jgi:hypothetical protein
VSQDAVAMGGAAESGWRIPLSDSDELVSGLMVRDAASRLLTMRVEISPRTKASS